MHPAPPERPTFDTGLWALSHVARINRRRLDPAAAAHELGLESRLATSIDIARAARTVGLKAKILRALDLKRLGTLPRPIIIRLKDDQFAVLLRMRGGGDGLATAQAPAAERVSFQDLAHLWSGEAVLVGRALDASNEVKPFGIGWFIDAIWRYRHPLRHVLLMSMFIQIFALATPLLFQVVIDKVLVHHSMGTLTLIVASMAVISAFDVTLQYLRTYALSHTTNRLDVELGSHMFRRLLHLPLKYFETRAAGQTVARIRELENIRTFLTGQGLTSIIDMMFMAIFFAILISYSVLLASIVIAILPLYIIVAALIKPLLRSRIEDKFRKGAESQQFLVESVVGAATIKAGAIEPLVHEQWEDRLASYVHMAFKVQMLGAVGQNIITYLTRITTILILFFGAKEVIGGHMTVGGLVAFNMIASQMTAPVLRLASLWQDFQQVQVSIDRLGDIMNSKPESGGGQLSELEPIKGSIRFKNVTFRYNQGGRPILSDVSFEIAPGEVIGIVGASGSGKSTLAKLLQRLVLADEGTITVDNKDVSQVHPAWLRRQIGVVLQENLLFNRTIHENIALAKPGMSRQRVIKFAKLAGADEFICAQPLGYDTMIVERGANLSGGQRQRISIARALSRNPRILIFDEATSALDYESERIIQENMRQIVKGRTVIIIAHRLAAVRDCDRIFGMAGGRLVESGSPEELLARRDGIYANLRRIQDGDAKAEMSAQ